VDDGSQTQVVGHTRLRPSQTCGRRQRASWGHKLAPRAHVVAARISSATKLWAALTLGQTRWRAFLKADTPPYSLSPRPMYIPDGLVGLNMRARSTCPSHDPTTSDVARGHARNSTPPIFLIVHNSHVLFGLFWHYMVWFGLVCCLSSALNHVD
jgi:hypothetical protein